MPWPRGLCFTDGRVCRPTETRFSSSLSKQITPFEVPTHWSASLLPGVFTQARSVENDLQGASDETLLPGWALSSPRISGSACQSLSSSPPANDYRSMLGGENLQQTSGP